MSLLGKSSYFQDHACSVDRPHIPAGREIPSSPLHPRHQPHYFLLTSTTCPGLEGMSSACAPSPCSLSFTETSLSSSPRSTSFWHEGPSSVPRSRVRPWQQASAIPTGGRSRAKTRGSLERVCRPEFPNQQTAVSVRDLVSKTKAEDRELWPPSAKE